MIRTEALSKTYGRRARAVTALEDVTLSMESGVWGVVGPNGAGKTTLLGLVLGFLEPTGGSISVDGRSPRRYLARHGGAYLPERFRLPPEWPVRAALGALARLEGMGGGAARARAVEVVERLGLEDHADRPVGTLSRGLTQRVGLAQAVLARRRLVVLDEPTEGLDPLWRMRFRELVADLAREERTVILASHDLAEVGRLADRVVLLENGRVRDILDAGGREEGPLSYRLAVAGATDVVRAAFPDARQEAEEAGADRGGGTAEGGKVPADPGSRTFLVSVADPGELSHRLAALIDRGAVVRAVTPLGQDLEARVRKRLEEG